MHVQGSIHSAYGMLTSGEWDRIVQEAFIEGVYHNGSLTGEDCPRCIFLNERTTAVLAARGVTVSG